jgi:Fusaric acid resistance protein-like
MDHISVRRRALKDVTSINRSAFSLNIGLRAGVFVATPLLLGLLTGQMELVYSTLGAWFVTNAAGPRTAPTPLGAVFVACFTEALAFGLGTLVGTTGLISILLMGVGVFFAMLLGASPKWAPVSTFTAIFFAVGVGLPGGSIADAGQRLVFSLIGGFWGLLAIGLRSYFIKRRKSLGSEVMTSFTENLTEARLAELKSLMERSEIIRQALVVGVSSAAGLAVGLSLGLPRDFWIIVTIILALRPSIPATINFSSMIVLGTLVGALIAASVTFEVLNDYLLWVFLVVFSVAFYATRGMNLGLSQVFMTPFIIVLLNILYRGEWYLAEVRILDVAIGGAVAVLTALFLENRRLALKGSS